MKTISLGMLIAAVLLNGCASSINVVRVEPKTVPTGVPWNLAMTQYTVTIKRQVTSCDNVLNGTVTVSAVAGKTLDEDQQYALSSSGVWATADIISTLAGDGTSTGLNAHSESQAAAIISSSVGILSAIAKVAAAEAGEAHFKCSKAVSNALAALKPAKGPSLKEKIAQETKEVATLTSKVAQYTTLYQGSKKNADLLKSLTDAMDQLRDKQAIMSDDQATLTASLKILTATQTITWPSSASTTRTNTPFTLDQSVAQSWVEWNVKPSPQVDSSSFNVWFALYAHDRATGGWTLPGEPAKGDPGIGVPVRIPRIGRLIACTDSLCDDKLSANWTPTDERSLVIEPDTPVLQFGQLYNVPLTGGTFKSEGAAIALDANGVPTSVEVFEKAAAAAAATAAAQSAASVLASLPAEIDAAKLAKTKAATDQITADNALAVAKASKQTAIDTASANAQTGLLNANLALTTAQANAQAAGPAGQLAVQTVAATQQLALANQPLSLAGVQANAAVAPAIDALNANTNLLNAQAAQINAQVALAKAQELLNP